MIRVLINADDYGWSSSCSKAIQKAFDSGLISTTTMICTGKYFNDAVESIQHSSLKSKIGIHFDLTEGTPLTEGIKQDPFFCEDGIFHMHINRLIPLTSEQKKHAYEELSAQANRFKQTGLCVHHADSHHHIHTAIFIFPIFQQVLKEYGINKVRIHRNIGNIPFYKKVIKKSYNHQLEKNGLSYSDYFGGFYDAQFFDQIKDDSSIEIMCHPDFDADGVLIDRNSEASYDKPCGRELKRLVTEISDPRFRIEL